jgi:ribonucleoside-diphosphate reductase alpha chain
MKVERKFTKPGQDPFATVEWTTRSSKISNPDGSVVFEMADAEVPTTWSQLATDIMVSKYFRKAGVPQFEQPYALPGGADAKVRRTERGEPLTGPERSARQVIHRLAGCWRYWGESHGYFDTPEDAEAFYDELVYMMVHQMCAPNSPQWFNTGLNWAYGITGPAQGHYVPDPETGEVFLASDAYTHPQPHACFIQSVTDDLVNPGGIMDLWVREARLFKYGSGTGTNFSQLRAEGERLSGGGKSSGLMSWLKIGDRAAGAIKSGGTTRRAAKMVCLDMDHPDIETFINWKVREEVKVAALVEGLKKLREEDESIRQTADRLGLELDYDFNGESYMTVSGQNSNNSVRIPDDFFDALDAGGTWRTTWRTSGEVAREYEAGKLWEDITYAAWRCADPGVQFDSTINAWHTCPNGGRINASNPCVTGDTLVATTSGLRRIADLVGTTVEVVNGDGQAAPVERVFRTGHKPVFELKTRAGFTLRLTADHLVKTANRGDVPACELTVDDEVLLTGAGFGDEFLPLPTAELLGAALGDGCVTRQPGQDFLFVTLGAEERDFAEELRGHIDHTKAWLSTGDRRGLRPSAVTETATGLRVGTSVAPVVEKLGAFAVLDRGSHEKRLTDLAFTLDRQTVAALLRGLFTADGTVANYGSKSQYVALDSTSLDLLRQVQVLLLGFGVKAKIYENRRAIGQATATLPDGRGGSAEYPVRQMHSLRISRASRVVFEREIGFSPASPKRERLRELNAGVVASADRMTDRVASLTPDGQEDVFDLTEPLSSHFVANGIVVHNCSEYMFLDNTACNLASLNVLKFYDSRTRTFDVEAYEHGIDLWTTVLEISVLMAAYPSERVAELSYRYRTLGLGFANLGAMAMQAGIPYDSDEARAVCACLSAILTGRSYRQSALMAGEHGPFPGFEADRDNMLRVIRNHRRAAHGVERDAQEWEGLRVRPVPIDRELCAGGTINIANADTLAERAARAWDDALAFGERHGYRNAQTTVIAPTGTIGLLMDCDTTGVEPDFALVKFKKLAGGGYFKIVNESVRPALTALGYSPDQVRDMLTYILGTLHLEVPLPRGVKGAQPRQTLAQWLRARGLGEADLERITKSLRGVFELSFAFSAWSLGDEALRNLGLDPEKAKADPGFNLLRKLGLKDKQIAELNETICGTQTIEGAPHIRPEHLPVFDCANTCGSKGVRFIAPEGHIRMMGAAQPFISGAISKTINLPNNATVEDIASCYRLSWELGLKANALYRDGCKLSQPLSNKSDTKVEADLEDEVDELGESDARAEVATAVADLAATIAEGSEAPARAQARAAEKTAEIVHRPMRRRLPDTRESITHKFNVAGHEGYLTVGLYEDSKPGELFITMAKEGSTIGGLMDSLGTATSVALQYGVPIESLVNKFTHQRFEPAGMTTNKDIPIAKSLVDYIFRWMGMEFIPGYREANSPRRTADPAGAQPDGPSDRVSRRAARLGESRLATTATPHAPTPAPTPAGAVYTSSVRERFEMQGAAYEASQTSTLSVALDSVNDAPPCDVCGTITVRSGTCYKCLNCGNSMGCS